MFTGIVETTGKVVRIDKDRDNIHFTVQTPLAGELKIDQSLSHNGVCLTVVNVDREKTTYVVTAVKETLERSNLGLLREGSKVNLERSMRADGLVDGHMVQGHVDQTAVCTKIEEANGSWYFSFEYKPGQDHITVPKGSISVDGVSLTVVDSGLNTFSVAIIPYTFEQTIFHEYRPGTEVNLEFDIIGKYVEKLLRIHNIIK
ncbi:MAG: riboflavin synthase [Bacteroidetes bacterium]|nr:riboflavin synthase [Bacteroidota bacterium]MBU1717917.1 riboflavin synthase [Bacteroidota bacterium]